MNKLKNFLVLMATIFILCFTYLSAEQITVDDQQAYYCRPIEIWCYQSPNTTEYYRPYYFYDQDADTYFQGSYYGTYQNYLDDVKLSKQEAINNDYEYENSYNDELVKDLDPSTPIYLSEDDLVLFSLDDKIQLVGLAIDIYY